MKKSQNKEYMYIRHKVGPFDFYRASSIHAELIRTALSVFFLIAALYLLTVVNAWYVFLLAGVAFFLSTEVLHYFYADHPPRWLMQTLRKKQR